MLSSTLWLIDWTEGKFWKRNSLVIRVHQSRVCLCLFLSCKLRRRNLTSFIQVMQTIRVYKFDYRTFSLLITFTYYGENLIITNLWTRSKLTVHMHVRTYVGFFQEFIHEQAETRLTEDNVPRKSSNHLRFGAVYNAVSIHYSVVLHNFVAQQK